MQKYIYKIHSGRLRKSRWKLSLPLDQARRNEEVISLASSQVLRWIDELNGVIDAEARATEIRDEIRKLRKAPSEAATRKQIKKLYAQLDAVQFKPDYMELVIDKEKDYYRACQGFSINGISYKRLLGTNGGIKNSTIVFVSERLHAELARRIDNGRKMDQAIVPAKLEAYKALACSASIPVSMPNGILVVKDCETTFRADTIYLNDDGVYEPTMEFRPDTEITMDASDGFGLMLPSLAERWSQELGLDYVMAGANTRFCWEKGMIYTFDFVDFAEKVAGRTIVKDVWGNDVDIRQVELIFTESMLKLWDAYDSLDHYLANCEENGYTVCVTKTCPKELESERCLNYQFIQSYKLSDEDIDELIEPTMTEIREVLGGDWRKAVLFLGGTNITADNIAYIRNPYIRAILTDERVVEDPFVKNTLYQLIHGRITDAKVGVIKVHGNYSMVSGDPYSLCQSIFGLPITGLLKAGEIYNLYWSDREADELVCFRAPMTAHCNIRKVHPCRTDEARYWYRYMDTCTIFNSWDTASAALNGCDFDGDLVMLTDNHVLVRKHVEQPALMCVQRKAEKKIPSIQDTIRSNIDSFGNDIGRTTNWITSMFEVQSNFDENSEEYRVLDYRIKCGQLFQQNCIDKAKGIISKPMPLEWHDRRAAMDIEDTQERVFARSIVADRKPYFMRYIYPDLARQYNKYIGNTERNAMRQFGKSVAEIAAVPYSELGERERSFLHYYDLKIPVGMGDCVMNRLCRKFEEAFDKYIKKTSVCGSFDYEIYKSNTQYTQRQFQAVRSLYTEYNSRVHNFKTAAMYGLVNDDESADKLSYMEEEFRRECALACPNEKALCDILLDLCYSKSSTRRFVWNMCAYVIIWNLLEKNGNIMRFPTADKNGDIVYCGERYSMAETTVEV